MSDRQPNIVLVCVDQQRADALGCYGSSICKTPNLDRFAAKGVRFEHAFVQNPVCSPQRAGYFTGRLGVHHGVLRNGPPMRTDVPTLPEICRDNGYRTAAFGKMHITPHSSGIATAPFYGFEHVECTEDSKVGPYLDWALENFPEYEGYLIGTCFNLPTEDEFYEGRRDIRDECLPMREKYVYPHQINQTSDCNWGYGNFSPLPEEAYQSTWITDRALSYVDNNAGGEPLFMWVSYVDPHNPFDPPERIRKMYDPQDMPLPCGLELDESLYPPHLASHRKGYSSFTDDDWKTLTALYYGGITFLDEQIGRLLEGLEERLDMENTIVWFLSDHGENLGEHGVLGKQGHHYDACIRVPFIASWPGHWESGATVDEIVETTDLMPTLLDAIGLGDTVNTGRPSFAPLLRGQPQPDYPEYSYSESYARAPEDRTPAPQNWAKTIRSAGYRVTFYPGDKYGECYDLADDPQEMNNLWHDESARSVIEEHRCMLLERLMMRDYPLPEYKHPV